MTGGIYTDQKCPICKEPFKDDRRRGLFCTNHPDQQATRFRIKFKGVYKRFTSYDEACRFLTGVRFKTDEGTFDERDYKHDNPLGFYNLAETYLALKVKTVKPKSYNNIKNYLYQAMDYFHGKNIKAIGYPEIEDFLYYRSDISDKTRANMKSALHDFWVWLKKRRIIENVPEMPSISFQLGFRKTVDKEVQTAIIHEVKRISYSVNPKIWLGIKWLSTYISIRPGELIRIKEGDLDIKNALIFISDPKEKKPKFVPMLDEDIDLIKSFPPAIPSIAFFRHPKGISGATEGEPFGPRLLYKYWKQSSQNLGINDVDLYGGTRHSSAKALRHHYSPEQIRRATMHSTNKAFERYFSMELDDVRAIYERTKQGRNQGIGQSIKNPGQTDIYADTHLTPKSAVSENVKVLIIKE
jgi:integrase